MGTEARPPWTTQPDANGAALASVLAAGIGAFAMGLFVILNEVGLFAAPTLYGPAGGVTGRTTFAAVIWLGAWGLLHARWRTQDIAPGSIFALTVVLVVLGVLGTFPPLWTILS